MYLTNLFIHRHASHTFCSDLKIISKQIFTHKHRQIVRQKLTFMRRRTTKKRASNIIANNRPEHCGHNTESSTFPRDIQATICANLMRSRPTNVGHTLCGYQG